VAARRGSPPWPPSRRTTTCSGATRVTPDCHPSEGASRNRTQITIIHRFCFFQISPHWVDNRVLP
jgi:hypothetical protein